MKIAVIGAGAIGGTLAAELIEQGFSVDCIEKNKKHIEKTNHNGLLVDGIFGKKIYKNLHLQEIPKGIYDIVFLVVKSIHTDKACKEIKKHLNPNGVIVSLQNGINNEQILKNISENNYIAGVVGHGATNIGPGHLRYTSKEKHFVIGRINGKTDTTLKRVANILNKIAPTDISTNIIGDQWGKLAMNCIINPFCAIYNQNFGKNVQNSKIRLQMIRVLTEVIQVGHSLNIKFTKLGGKYNIEKIFLLTNYNNILAKNKLNFISRLKNYFEIFRASLFLHLIILKHGKIMSSLWQDLQKKQKTEIDFLNGYICKKGLSTKISTPENNQVYKEILYLEKKLKI